MKPCGVGLRSSLEQCVCVCAAGHEGFDCKRTNNSTTSICIGDYYTKEMATASVQPQYKVVLHILICKNKYCVNVLITVINSLLPI